jgi:hypothetical protein
MDRCDIGFLGQVFALGAGLSPPNAPHTHSRRVRRRMNRGVLVAALTAIDFEDPDGNENRSAVTHCSCDSNSPIWLNQSRHS